MTERELRQEKVDKLKDKIRKECRDIVNQWGMSCPCIELSSALEEESCKQTLSLFAVQRLYIRMNSPHAFMTEYNPGSGIYVVDEDTIDLFLMDSCNVAFHFLDKLRTESHSVELTRAYEHIGLYLADESFRDLLPVIETIILRQEKLKNDGFVL